MSNFARSLQFTWLPQNDGQGDHTTIGDHGAETNMGVTLASYAAHRLKKGIKTTTAADLKNATLLQLSEVIQSDYWAVVRGDDLPLGTDLLVFDFGVGSGPGASAKILQAKLGVSVDGQIGPATIKAAVTVGPALLSKLAATHAAFYRALNQPKFVNGWLRRNNDRLTLATLWTKKVTVADIRARVTLVEEPVPSPSHVVDEGTIAAALDAALRE